MKIIGLKGNNSNQIIVITYSKTVRRIYGTLKSCCRILKYLEFLFVYILNVIQGIHKFDIPK